MPHDFRCHLPAGHESGHVYVDTNVKAEEFRVTSCFTPMVPLAPEFEPTLLKMAMAGLTKYGRSRDRTDLGDARLAIGVLWGLTEEDGA